MKLCRCRLMKEIQTAAFAAHEAVLYLDGHPDDKRALAYFNMQNEKMKNAVAVYDVDRRTVAVGIRRERVRDVRRILCGFTIKNFNTP